MFNLLASQLHLPSQLPEHAQLAEQTVTHLCSQMFLPIIDPYCFSSTQASIFVLRRKRASKASAPPPKNASLTAGTV